MGTYHWDRHIGCFRGIYNVRRQVLFCGVCIHLRGRPKRTKIKKWKLRCDWNFWKSLAVEKGTSTCGNPVGTVHASTRTSKGRIRAVRDARRTTSDVRWMSISQRTIEMDTYHWEGTRICKHPFDKHEIWHLMTSHGAWWRMALWYTVRGLEARRGWQRKRRLNLRKVATRECRGQGHSGWTMMDHVTWMPWPSISDMPKIAPLWCFWSVPYIF